MSFAIFDESFYLKSYQDVATAVAAGTFSSGLQHFQQFGSQEGRTKVSPFWSESGYFSFGPVFAPPKNNDVLTAVMNKVLPSGLAHFIQFGEEEGRFPEESYYNDRYYLQRYPDIANAVTAKAFPSGFSHFIKFGKNEGREGSPFNEKVYLAENPDVAAEVNAGTFTSGLEHYTNFGVSEGRDIVVSGTSGSDYVNALYLGSSRISGVGIDVITGQTTDIVPTSLGVGEVDTLIGSGGQDTILLGIGRSAANPSPKKFYVGGGDADYAMISGLDIIGGDAISFGEDAIQLAGKPEDYVIESSNDSFQTKIFAITNESAPAVTPGNPRNLDLVAVVENSGYVVTNVDPTTETFTIKTQFPEAPVI